MSRDEGGGSWNVLLGPVEGPPVPPPVDYWTQVANFFTPKISGGGFVAEVGGQFTQGPMIHQPAVSPANSQMVGGVPIGSLFSGSSWLGPLAIGAAGLVVLSLVLGRGRR
jgi:hypothetical protein